MSVEDLGFLRVLPPVVAIILAIWWKNVLPALFVGIWTGTTLLSGVSAGGRAFDWKHVSPWTGLQRLFDPLAFDQLSKHEHIQIILFTTFLGCMIGVMSHSGGSAAVVERMARWIHSRRGGQVTIWLAGLAVFVDDYANSLLIGGTMRPVTDRLKISREKLAFIVDATAAPVAGLVIVSTWAGTELGYITTGLNQANVVGADQLNDTAFQVFIATIPYRFYPILMLLFVFAVAWTGRDFGAMLAAEERALGGQPVDAHTASTTITAPQLLRPESPPFMRNALIPIAVLLGGIAIGLAWSVDNSPQVLLLASFAASVAAVICALVFRTMPLGDAIDAWLEGGKSMFTAIVILTMAWMIAGVCNKESLDTAGYLSSLVGTSLAPEWLPAVSFLLSAAVAFATGSSFATMGLLIPVFTSLAWNLLGGADPDMLHDPRMLGTIGSVLAGAIFGDHCSPISDTTVLSSAATDCDHLQHVATQMPYAFAVGMIALVLGCLPVGFGLNVWLCLSLQIAAVIAVVRCFGKPPQPPADRL